MDKVTMLENRGSAWEDMMIFIEMGFSLREFSFSFSFSFSSMESAAEIQRKF